MMIRELAYIGIASPRHEEWLTYGTEVLGCAWHLAVRTAPCGLRVDDAVHRITIRPGDRDELLYTGWAFTNEVELATYLDRLRLAGVDVTPGTAEECRDRGVAELAWVTDPWGRATSSCRASTAGRGPSGRGAPVGLRGR